MTLTSGEIKDLQIKANDIRVSIIEMLSEAKSGHTSGSLDMADIFVALYFKIMKHDPSNPDWADRDRLVLSNGHIAPVRYATMAHAGYFSIAECMTLRKYGSRLQGHPERHSLPGLESTSGPLGSGLSQASGMAWALRYDGNTARVFCAGSDGEHNEGNVWEAMLWAAKEKLSNLVYIIDRNFIQIDGNTEDVLPLEPFADKYRAFNWHVIEIDGHDMQQIVSACDEAQSVKDKPVCIVARTIPGKGIIEIENDHRWHGAPPGKGPTDKISADKQKEIFLRRLAEVRDNIQ